MPWRWKKPKNDYSGKIALFSRFIIDSDAVFLERSDERVVFNFRGFSRQGVCLHPWSNIVKDMQDAGALAVLFIDGPRPWTIHCTFISAPPSSPPSLPPLPPVTPSSFPFPPSSPSLSLPLILQPCFLTFVRLQATTTLRPSCSKGSPTTSPSRPSTSPLPSAEGSSHWSSCPSPLTCQTHLPPTQT